MKLIMTESHVSNNRKWNIADDFGFNLAVSEYDGLSTKEIGYMLSKEDQESVIVTADSRLLGFSGNGKVFSLSDVYLYCNGEIKNITETTRRKLRDGHNLMNLYEAGEFKFNPIK